MSIDRNSPMPLYYQLKRLLLAKIESGELQAGDAFPTEQQIRKKYNISRTTVRQALSELEDEGKITRHRGRGTFVAEPKISHHPDQYPKLADHISEQGNVPGWRLLAAEWQLTNDRIATTLGISTDEKVFCLQRLRLENDTPIGLHQAYVVPQFATAIDTDFFTKGGSLRYLRGLPILDACIADRTLEAVAATKTNAHYLNVAIGYPLLCVKRIIYTPDRDVVEFLNCVYRGDRFEYHINNMKAISPINA